MVAGIAPRVSSGKSGVSQKLIVTTSGLPEHLDNQARADLWREAHAAQVAMVEIGISDRMPFQATLEATLVGPLVYSRLSGTINRVSRTTASMRNDVHDSYSLVINMGATPIGGVYRDMTLEMATGAAFLDGAEKQDMRGGDHNDWLHLTLPKKLTDDLFPRINDRQGLLIRPEVEPLRLMRGYLQMLDGLPLSPEAGMQEHISATILDLVGLATGAKGDGAELAGLRGLRAARLQAVLDEIRSNFTHPGLSAPRVAARLGLSPRYVQDLLATTGVGFTDRVLELRLLRVRDMLRDHRFQAMRIGDIALGAGFNDISYFNRSFRRRFGMSPGAAR